MASETRIFSFRLFVFNCSIYFKVQVMSGDCNGTTTLPGTRFINVMYTFTEKFTVRLQCVRAVTPINVASLNSTKEKNIICYGGKQEKLSVFV